MYVEVYFLDPKHEMYKFTTVLLGRNCSDHC